MAWTILLVTLYAGQACLGGYALYFSVISITKLQQYEAQSKKAAEWSSTAADQLYRTRTTQAAGAVAILISLTTSLTMAYLFLSSSSNPSYLSVLLGSAGNAAATLFAHNHISNFWRNKAKVPLPMIGADYNSAITTTNKVRTVLGYLTTGWIMCVVVGSIVAV